jgi:hypothetical protein
MKSEAVNPKPTYRASLIKGGDGMYLTVLYKADGVLLYWMVRQ